MPAMTNHLRPVTQPKKPHPIKHISCEAGAEVVEPCILCGAETLDNSCKVKCLNCGYTRDCSDP